jgi:hypothetical protein
VITIDPARDPGLTMTLRDRSAALYTVTIPADRWQLQPPLGSRWDYRDQNGILNGVRKARVKRIVKGGIATGYAIEFHAKGIVAPTPADPGVTVEIDVPRSIVGNIDLSSQQAHRTCRVGPTKLVCK